MSVENSTHQEPAPTDPAPRFLLKYKLALVFSCLTVLILGAFWLTVKNQLSGTLQQQADSLGNILAAQTAESITELVLANDLLSLNVVLNQLTNHKDIDSVAVYNVNNQLVASAGSPGLRNSSLNTVYSAQITLQDSIAGTLRLTLNPDLILSGLNNYQPWFWGILALGVLLTITAALAMASHITSPLHVMAGWLAYPLESEAGYDGSRNDELALVQRSCAGLLQALQSQDSRFTLGEDNGGSADALHSGVRVQASILAIQVISIDTAIELLHPSTLARLLSEYHHLIQQAGRLYGGDVHQHTGDAVRMVFDSRLSRDHGFNAVCAAQLFLLLMNKVNRNHRATGSPVLEFRLGIHTGDVFSVDTGNEHFSAHTFMGKAMDASEQFCRLGQAGMVIISESTFSQAGGNDRLTPAGSIEMPGEADKTPGIAYILSSDMGHYTSLLLQ
ncbi:MAG: adenylate/guanylate cyclase domain-containing protein, partial [Pseudohongiellaceae bacterium]